MTIEQRIKSELKRLNTADPALYGKALPLYAAVEKIIAQLKVHLGEISTQMKEYDKHDASHSETVLGNIEKLLRDGGIERLSLLEAMALRLCCYFHDSGMILPECYLPLLEDIEREPRAELPDDLRPWLVQNRKTYEEVRDQFYCPDSEEGYEAFLIDELDRYQKYRLGLPEDISGAAHFRRTRHGYLRRSHGERADRYAQNLIRLLEGISYAARSDLAEAVGRICASHCQEITEVRNMETKLELIDACPELRCNVRYLAMLLRLGDVIHFSSDRASRTAYAERATMDAESELHWKTKFQELEYAIRPREKGVSISYSGCFEDPKAYYFLQSHLDRVDEELRNYAAFVSDMHGEPDGDRYALGLPTNVLRDGVRPNKFKPDQELKFRLEHRKIITLLMGMRLYDDEFMCLRELYQNALDACRCMRAENRKNGLSGELKIEFGLGNDAGGAYLYCRDEGTGMTEEIVKKFLLRIGNSYYQSDEFRRSNAQWGDAVAPVSEFGIGLLSCYMIASRIEIITRHHTLPETAPIWVCMEDSDDYGYFRTPGRPQEKQLGRHGTIVKLYLKQEYIEKTTGFIPEDPKDAVFVLTYFSNRADTWLTAEAKEFLSRYKNSLYHRIQQFVHIPEDGIPVWVQGDARRVKLFRADERYELEEKLTVLAENGIAAGSMFWGSDEEPELFGTRFSDPTAVPQEDIARWLRCFDYYPCIYQDPLTGISAETWLHLPNTADMGLGTVVYLVLDLPIAALEDRVYIDGIPVQCGDLKDRLTESGICWHFRGKIRPRLTVDRGSIRGIPENVPAAQTAARKGLMARIIALIREHFRRKPQALTAAAKIYLFRYLFQKFGDAAAVAILRELSGDVLRDHRYYGAPLDQWFHGETIKLDVGFLAEYDVNNTATLLKLALYSCTRLEFEDDYLQMQTTIPETIDQSIRYTPLWYCAVGTDNWPEKYKQYDAVREYPKLVQSHVLRLLSGQQEVPDRLVYQGWGGILGDMKYKCDPVQPEIPDWRDVIFALGEKTGGYRPHSCDYRDPFVREGNKRYVLYLYSNPRPLTEEDEIFLTQYCADVPQYREGVEKGWSILFYNYKVGYVIAPGIVDRMEMLKLLPDEARNHDDGLEYYFTDGTRAF